VISFILVGEEPYAQKVAKAIFADGRGRLVPIYTNTAKAGGLRMLAEAQGVPVHNAALLSGDTPTVAEADWLININSAVILPAGLLDRFPDRALNLHNGPLPGYAGRHVHQWGIRNGETEFAATIHHMEAKIDTGTIVKECFFPIDPLDTGLSLFRRSFDVGAELFVEVLERIFEGGVLPAHQQDLSKRHIYRHADALDGRIDWRWEARKIVDFARAGNYRPLISPTYSAYLEPEAGDRILVLRAVADNGESGPVGQAFDVDGGSPGVFCGNGAVRLTEAFRDGRRMKTSDWSEYFNAVPGHRLIGRGEPHEVSSTDVESLT
jgi:methionyl-tRNA formyltransferase